MDTCCEVSLRIKTIVPGFKLMCLRIVSVNVTIITLDITAIKSGHSGGRRGWDRESRIETYTLLNVKQIAGGNLL